MGIFDFLFGPPDVEKLEANRDVEGLIKALEYNKDSWVRKSAAEALGKLGDPKAVAPLIHALKDEDWRVRMGAADLLGKLGDPKAVDPLIDALDDKYKVDVGVTALEALRKIGKPAVRPLINALTYEFYFGGYPPSSADVRWFAAICLEEIGEPAVEPLIRALDSNVRWVAAVVLGKIGDSRAVEPLIEALKYEDDTVQKTAAEVLGEIGDDRAVGPLRHALESWNNSLRRDAKVALKKIKEKKQENILDF